MGVWQDVSSAPLRGVEGDLLSVRITVEAFLLEDLLDALGEAPFPINPEIKHNETLDRNGRRAAAVTVEFPVWQRHVATLESLLRLLDAEVHYSGMLAELSA